MKKGIDGGGDDVEIAREARTPSSENYMSLLTLRSNMCKLIIITNADYFLLSDLGIPFVI